MKEKIKEIVNRYATTKIQVEPSQYHLWGQSYEVTSVWYYDKKLLEELLSLFNQEKIEMLEGLKMEKKVQPIPKSNREAVEGFVYHYWCYNPSTGTSIYPDSVELDVVAGSETEALKIAKKMVKDRGTYKLQTVSNLSQLNKGDKE